MRKLRSVLFAFMLLLVHNAAAQEPDSLVRRYEVFTDLCQSEKLFLHMDRTYYAAGETIWFNGYLEYAWRRPYRTMSNFIYVELLDEAGHVCRRVKVKRSDDSFPGSLNVPDDVKSGDYTLRAYTLWQTASQREYFFHQSIKLLGPYGAPAAPAKKYPDGLDVSFYPEGGRYFAGLRSRMGFKAMDPSGRSVEINGRVVDSEGKTIAAAVTRHDGMGLFSITAEQGKQYYLVTESGESFRVPDPSREGATLNIVHLQETLLIKAIGTGDYSLYCRDAAGLRRLVGVKLTGGTFACKLADSDLLPGINHLLLVTDSGQIASERLFYIYDQSPLCCSVEQTEGGVKARSLVKANVCVSDSLGVKPDGRFSVSVLRASLRTRTQDDNLVSYMSLSSELEGTLNNPKYYFDESVPLAERKNAMNLLMMIQGWRYYDMPALMSREGVSVKLPQGKELMQTVRGRVERQSSSKLPTNFLFTVMIPSKKFATSMIVKEGSGFVIDSLDFEENTDFLINIGRSKFGLDYCPKWNGDTFAEESAYLPAPGNVISQAVREEIPLFSEVMATDTLSEAKVTAKPVEDDLGLINGKVSSAKELEFYKDRTLIEYLSVKAPWFLYDGDMMYNRRIMSMSSSSGESSDDESDSEDAGTLPHPTVKLIVNDNEEEWFVYNQVRVEEIDAISISNLADSYYNAPGGVVSIKFKEGATISSGATSPNLIHFVPLGYCKPSRFYSPRYDLGEKPESFDNRNTVFWDPCVEFKDGKAEIDFCTTDQEDYPYYVRIEGKTADGRLFSGSGVLTF